MGELAAKWMHHQRKQDHARDDGLTRGEQKNLDTLRRLAKEKGATLANNGKGGLPPSLALHVFKRDKYKCVDCGTNKNITLHHIGGIVESEWANKKGHKNEPDNIETLCESCHDKKHEEAKAEGIDSSQVTPEGDKGTKRDHGLPDAEPPEK